MVSTELLRRYPFFGFLSHDQLTEVAMLTDEVEIPKNSILFSIGDRADALYFLETGSIDLHYVVVDEHLPELRKDFHIGTINPGEVFGISALIEPYKLTATAVTTSNCTVLKVDATGLHRLCEQDHDLAYGLQKQIAKTTMERLHATRILLAAATAPT
jgi:CRP/FNR family cyclic AMP-dependent transcriptional regulator